MKLSIASWNINGITHKPDQSNKVSKSEDPIFHEYIKKHDIVGILETKVGKDDKINIDGYKTFQISRKKSKNNRFFGGICVAIKEHIADGVTVLTPKGGSEFVWVKLDRYFFNISENYYVCFIYVSPDKSGKEFGIDVYDKVTNELSSYSTKGKCILLGDMNAHTQLESDFIVNDEVSEGVDLPIDYIVDMPMKRRNCDKSKLNDHGKALLDMCISSGFRILNGRKIGDMLGDCSYFGPMCKNPTLIDYGLAHYDHFKDVNVFCIQDLSYLSDHCLIYAQISVNPRLMNSHTVSSIQLEQIPKKFVWENDREGIFLEHLNNHIVHNKILENISNPTDQDPNSINKLEESVTEIYLTAAEKTFRREKRFCTTKKKPSYAKHFDKDCIHLLKELKNMSRKLSRCPNDAELRKSYYLNRRNFKKIVKRKLANEKENLITQLSTKTENTRDFWKIIEKLKNCTHGKNKSKNDVSPSIWMHHFKDLMCKDDNDLSDEQKEVSNFIGKEDNWQIFNSLSFKITDNEIKTAVKSLKKGKACGGDLISNEMLKSSVSIMSPILNKLFNTILQSGKYPKTWASSWLKPLHKGGDTKDPNRYRGISLMSCVGKLFCSILNNRLVKFLESKGNSTKSQIGFTKDCRTSDHILTLKTLIDKYTQGNSKKLYTCFIDFRKAFDSVWRNGLMYKLLKADIGGLFGKLLQNIYSNTSVQIKLDSGLTEEINDNIGVKQGCVLSSTLFKLFINDLPDIFTENCEPVKLYNEKLNCLMFADDIVLISESKSGLQCALDKLFQYCEQWKLNVNSDKSKIMIFDKSGRAYKDTFSLGPIILENVKDYTYLGINFTINGTFNKAINTLDQKAKKAMFKIRSTLFKTNVSPKTALHIYDSLVRPIQTYGAEAWGAFIKNIPKMFDIMDDRYHLFDEACFEKTDLKFSKSVLSVHRMSSNAAVRGELGRYPIIIHILKQVLKNWFRIVEYDQNSLLYDTYLCNLQMVFEKKNCWLSNIRKIVYDTLGLKHLWENQGTIKHVKGAVNNIKSIFEFQWLNAINKISQHHDSGNKLRTYALFKDTFNYEDYLDFTVDYKKRKNVTKLRISAHKLEIESGRYQNHKKGKVRVQAKDRVCKFCSSSQVEDEKHVVMYCNNYADDRRILFKLLQNIFPGVSCLDEDEQFNLIMKCQDSELFKMFTIFLEKIATKRGEL